MTSKVGCGRLVAPFVCAMLAAGGAKAQVLENLVDNGASGFQSTGKWTNSTSGQFVGVNHQVSTIVLNVIDNTSPQFYSQGNWQSGTSALESALGGNYKIANPISPTLGVYASIIIDNITQQGSAAQGCGTPSSTTLPDMYGQNYVRLVPNSSATTCKFSYVTKMAANSAGNYPVRFYAHWPASATHASNARVYVKDAYNNVRATYTVNQKLASGEWYFLGELTSAQAGSVVFDATGADGVVAADAVKIESANLAQSNLARWTLPANLTGVYDIYARWPKVDYAEVYPAWILVGGTGGKIVETVSEREFSGHWRYVGSLDANGSQKNFVQLEHFSGGGYLLADAIAYVPSGTLPTATWSSPTTTGSVDIYANWVTDTSRSSNVSYVVNTRFATQEYRLVGGAWVYQTVCYPVTQVVKVNQTTPPPSDGILLGSFQASTNSVCAGATVTLMPDDRGGTLSADSMDFLWLKAK